MQNKPRQIAAKDEQGQGSKPELDKTVGTPAWLRDRLKYLYEKNPHVGLLRMQLAEVSEGAAVLTMPVIREVHGNLYGMVHGGALASLADTAMGVACASTGKRVVTLDLSTNFIASAGEGETVKAAATLIHGGRSTMVVDCEMTDSTGRLLAKARGTFFVIGQFESAED
jgi:1,4-dihydroxy-2-naphthoyl-CoA hydrolase